MSLQNDIMEAIKTAMRAKDTVTLESLRAVKSAILLAQTETNKCNFRLTGCHQYIVQIARRNNPARKIDDNCLVHL